MSKIRNKIISQLIILKKECKCGSTEFQLTINSDVAFCLNCQKLGNYKNYSHLSQIDFGYNEAIDDIINCFKNTEI